jgi:hypothetical protein
MARTRTLPLAARTGVAALIVLAACGEVPSSTARSSQAAGAASKAPVASTPQQTTIASGLLYPRGIAFDKKGVLYVAEAGTI